MTNANSGKRVQYILKVGSIDPTYLQRMEVEKMSLHRAFLKCTDRDNPKPVKVKKPATVSTQTETPKHSAPTSTADTERASFDEFIEDEIIENAKLRTPTVDFTSDPDNVVFCIVCKNCGVKNRTMVSKEILQHGCKMKANFYLRKPKEDCISAIYASICFFRKRVILFPCESIHSKNWDFDEGMPKSSGGKNSALATKLLKAKLLYNETYEDLFKIYGKNIQPRIFKNAIDGKNNSEPTIKIDEPILILDFF